MSQKSPLPEVSTTIFDSVKAMMIKTEIPEGPHHTVKGLRHGFGVSAIQRSIQLNMLSRWMGYGSLEVTAIYANAVGKEEADIAARMWE